MKIPKYYDELDSLSYNPKTNKFRLDKKSMYFILKPSCKTCGDEFFARCGKGIQSEYCSNHCKKTGKAHHYYDKKVSDHTKNKISISMKGKIRSKPHCYNLSKSLKNRFSDKTLHPSWKGGVSENNIPLYNTYKPQLDLYEEIRRSPNDDGVLEVRCTYCNKWYTPSRSHAYGRVSAINGKSSGEYRFYCSDGCKSNCDIFGQQKYYKGNKQYKYTREVQPQLRKLVLERDNWICQKCNGDTDLHCHHYEGINQNPIESADIDNCITLCKSCHKIVHKQDGCTTYNMRCK